MISMQLKVTNIHGQIGIKRNDAVLSIRQSRPKLEIRTDHFELNTKINPVKIKIDQSQCFSEAGLKSMLELTDEFARRGKEAAVEAINKIVDDGNRMAMIENKADAFAEIDAANFLPPPVDYNIALIPQSRPKIDVEGDVSFNPKMGKVNIKVKTINKPEISATYPRMNFYMEQKPEFNFKFVGKNVDVKV